MIRSGWMRLACFAVLSFGTVLLICDLTSAQAPVVSGCMASAPYVCQGDKGVYNASAGTIVNSHAYIDASVLTLPVGDSSGDVCAHIGAAYSNLSTYKTNVYTFGSAVIDVRGVTPGSTSCSASTNPWPSGNTQPPAVVLLPTGVTKISSTWYLPSGTKLVGQGVGSSTGTVIQATSSLANNWMIQMGTASSCTGVSLESLTLDGAGTASNGQVVNGITNSSCGYQSYVDHVWLYRMLGTGLSVAPGAEHSGPYSDITFNTADASASTLASTNCASLSASGTHGIHQMTCTIGSPTANATSAIKLDGSNNSLVDIRVEGFINGVLIGSSGDAVSSNVLKNVDGDSNPATGATAPVVVININGSNVTDLVILGLANTASNTTTNDQTIQDNATATILYDNYVAMYALGRPGATSGSYSRFTTSPYAANWSVGSGAPTTNTCKQVETAPSANGQSGSLYSDAQNGNLYICTVGNTWQEAEY
jgi:hypothetical protein